MRWLKKEAHGRQLCIYMIGCLVLDFTYAFGVFGAAYLLKIDIPPVSREKIPIFTISFPLMLLGVVFIEEVMFRLPLAVVIEKGWTIARVLVVALALSVVFGVLHGSIHHIFMQGVGGFIYSLLFLKSGGLQRNYPKAVTVTTATHFLFDAIIVGCVIAGGATSI